jgi:hypothetical protein
MMNVCSDLRPTLQLAIRNALSTRGPRKKKNMAELDQRENHWLLPLLTQRSGIGGLVPSWKIKGDKFFWLVSPYI